MNQNVIRLLKKTTPIFIEVELERFFGKERYRQKKKRYVLTKQIVNFLELELQKHKDDEVEQVLKFLKKRLCKLFPYDFVDKYNWKSIKVYSDMDCGMKYVLYSNRRLYFPRYMDVKTIQRTFNALLTEQDINSPHCYQMETFQVEQDDIVADIGAAEGLFHLW